MNKSLTSLGWDVKFAESYKPYDRQGNMVGRVARVDRGVCTLLTKAGTTRASLGGRMLGIVAKDSLAMPSVGDWAVIRQWTDDRCTIEAILPRRSALVRSTAGKTAEGQAIVANIDTVAVVEALDPDPDPGRIERLMALAFESGATPILVLTKADAVPDVDLLVSDLKTTAPGSAVLAVSAVTGLGLEQLHRYLSPGQTLAMVGASGGGKSTLVNSLAGAEVMVTRELRADGRGRHTTSHRAMVTVPTGGVVLDTPGLRLVGLFDRRSGDAAVPADGLAHAFNDVDALATRCRFSDCSHESEPDCAVREAITTGDLTARRLQNWRKLQREQAFERNRVAARAHQAQRNARRERRNRLKHTRDDNSGT